MLSLQGFRTHIQPPSAADEETFLAAMRDSIGLHHPWVSAPKDHAGWERYMTRLERDNEAGFLVKRLEDGVICGVVNLNIITYEALCGAYISYFGVAGQAEKGYAVAREEYEKKARGHTQFWEYLQALGDMGLIGLGQSGKGMVGKTSLISLPDVPSKVLEEKLLQVIGKG